MPKLLGDYRGRDISAPSQVPTHQGLRADEEAPCFVSVVVGIKHLGRVLHSTVAAEHPTKPLGGWLLAGSHQQSPP